MMDRPLPNGANKLGDPLMEKGGVLDESALGRHACSGDSLADPTGTQNISFSPRFGPAAATGSGPRPVHTIFQHVG